MANTYTSSLTDSLQTIIASARSTREYKGIVPNLVDKQTLSEGTGTDWIEVQLAALTAQAVSESEELDNPQTISDTSFSITPTVVGIHTVLTDRVRARISSKVYAQIGKLGQEAIQRKKDEDGIVMFDGATTSLCGAGTTLTSGYVMAAESRIRGNVTEPSDDTVNCVLHPYQMKDIKDELIASVGTYPVGPGITADVFTNGTIQGKVGGVFMAVDGNITIDSADDAKGAVFARESIVLVQGRSPWAKELRNEKLGGGATEYLLYDEYAYGERSTGNWLYEIYSDATAPTS